MYTKDEMIILRNDINNYLNDPKFKGTYILSYYYLSKTIFFFILWSLLIFKYTSFNYRIIIIDSLFSLFWGMLVIRSFILFHDCGHGSFIQNIKNHKLHNWICLNITSILCSTPSDWNIGHKLHHNNIGKLGQNDYDWGETIFHTKEQYIQKSGFERKIIRILRYPPLFFLLAPALTWFIRMRLPFELRNDRKAAYRTSNKIINTTTMLLKYNFAYKNNIFAIVLFGDYIAMFIGVLLFHLQHVFENGYVRNIKKNEEWKLIDAALDGSSMITIPEYLKWVTLGIEYHHIHHLVTKIPGYNLRTVHENAPHHIFKNIKILNYKIMYESLWLEIWDQDKQKYTTFSNIEKELLTTF